MPTRCEIALTKVVADLAIFLEFTGENRLDQGAAINALEQIAAGLQMLSASDKHHLTAMFIGLSRRYPADKTAFVSHLPEALGGR